MRIQKLEFKNILTFGGDIINTIELSDSGSLTQISGENGLGKSNVTRLLQIGLYYQYPSLVSNIINDLSTEGYIKIFVQSGGANYQVNNIFKSKKLHSIQVHKNGVLQDWGNISKASSLVMQEIATIPYTIFSNILSTSIDSQSSLLKLSAKDGRDIVNNVFDLSDVNKINDRSVAPEFSIANTNHNKSLADIDATEKIIESTQDSIDEIKLLDEEINATKKTKLNNDIAELGTEKETLDIDISADTDFVTSLDNEIRFASYSKDMDALESLKSDLADANLNLTSTNDLLESLNEIESSRYMDNAIKTNSEKTAELETIKSTLEIDIAERDRLQEVIDTKNTRSDDVREFAYFRERMQGVNANRKLLLAISPKIAENNTTIDTHEKSLLEIAENIRKNNEAKDSLNIKLEFYKKGKCAICDVDFTTDGYPEIIAGIEKQIGGYKSENDLYGITRTGINAKIKVLKDANTAHTNDRAELIATIKATSKALPKLVTDEVVLDFNQDIDLEYFDKYDWKDDLVKLSVEVDETTALLDAKKVEISNAETRKKNIEKGITDLVFEAKLKFGLDISTYVPVEVVNNQTDEEIAKDKVTHTTEKNRLTTLISDIEVSKKVIENKWETIVIDGVDLKSEYELRHTQKKFLPMDIDQCEEKRKEYVVKLKISNDRLTIVNSEIQRLNSELEELNSDSDSEHVAVLKGNLEKTNTILKSQMKSSIVTKNELESMMFLKSLYNAGLLKNALVGRVIGDINATIHNIMVSADVSVSVSFNEEFIPSFTKFGEPILYNQLSVGQLKMLEIVSIISVVTYYKKSFPSINFLYVDEALSSLSDSNTHKMLSVIVEWVVLKLGINVFLTSHAHIANTILNGSIKLSVKNGYTVMDRS